MNFVKAVDIAKELRINPTTLRTVLGRAEFNKYVVINKPVMIVDYTPELMKKF